jgi:hypothetical protein
MTRSWNTAVLPMVFQLMDLDGTDQSQLGEIRLGALDSSTNSDLDSLLGGICASLRSIAMCVELYTGVAQIYPAFGLCRSSRQLARYINECTI